MNEVLGMDTFKRHLQQAINQKKQELYLKGKIPILISAPHYVKHLRENHILPAETYTGVLGFFLHQHFGCHLICNLNENVDPNYDNHSIYREQLKEIVEKEHIQICIDLHQLSPTREQEIEIGTSNQENIFLFPNLGKQIQNLFQNNGFQKTFLDQKYVASFQNTVSKSLAMATSIPCLQIEMNSALFMHTLKKKKIFNCFKKLILFLKKEFLVSLSQRIIQNNETWQLIQNRQSLPIFDACKDFIVIKAIDNQKANLPKNAIIVHQENPQFLLSKAFLIFPNTGAFTPCDIYYDTALKNKYNLKENELIATSSVLASLHIQNKIATHFKVFVLFLPFAQSNHIKVQSIEKIQEKQISISKKTQEILHFDSKNKIYFYQLYHPLTNASMMIPKDKIIVDESLKEDEIRLSYMQRNMLDLEIPTSFSDQSLFFIKSHYPQQIEFFEKVYDAEGTLLSSTTYEDKEQLKKKFSDLNQIQIIPMIDSYNFNRKKSLFERLVDWIVGNSSTYLRVIRPYQEDEDNQIVRLSKDNMRLLGVEAMEQVVIYYSTHQIRCKVVAFDEDDKRIEDTNKKPNLNCSIGIPTCIRKQLNMEDIRKTVKVSRDTKFIFKKKLSNSLLSSIFTVFSSLLLFNDNIWVAFLVSIVLIPLIIYAIFSDSRANKG